MTTDNRIHNCTLQSFCKHHPFINSPARWIFNKITQFRLICISYLNSATSHVVLRCKDGMFLGNDNTDVSVKKLSRTSQTTCQ